jgi:hypothetical protein
MSFKGEIEAKCPSGCEPFAAEVWSFVNGQEDDDLRLSVLFRELNLLLCPQCEKPFFADAAYVYYEPRLELMAFVMPESYRAEAERWRKKMHEDFVAYKTALKELPVDLEPEIFFGHEDLALLLEREDFRGEEREVMEAVAAELGLGVYRAAPGHARAHGLPASLPYAGAKATPDSVIEGLEKLLAANDRLTAYSDYLKELRSSKALPPAKS